MNRRSFLRLLGLGAVAAPVVAKSLLTPGPEKAAKSLAGWKQTFGADQHYFEEAFTNDIEFYVGDKELPNAYKLHGINQDLTDFLTILEPEDTPKLTMFRKGPGRKIPARNSNDYLYTS